MRQSTREVPDNIVDNRDEDGARDLGKNDRVHESNPAICVGGALTVHPVQTGEEVPGEDDIDDGVAEEQHEVDAEHAVLQVSGAGSKLVESESNKKRAENVNPDL